jgi:hypothetical protein
MRPAFIDGRQALVDRLRAKAQVAETAPQAEPPSVLESFLAHLRLLVGVPFDYLVPDARFLPDESIRFFFLDRSWTDRLVDGALAVGKIGTREQAHHQAHAAPLAQTLDVTERAVRDLQRARVDFVTAKAAAASNPSPPAAGVVTGFLLRSAAVAGWPDMNVRAFDTVLPEPVDEAAAAAHKLTTLRLERLSPGVLLALFDGMPKLVWCEEPHHGVQFGVQPARFGFVVERRRPTGENEPPPAKAPVGVPVRASNGRVLSIAGLRRELAKAQVTDPQMVAQTGSAALAIELLALPWRQRFEGSGGPDLHHVRPTQVRIDVVARTAETATIDAVRALVPGENP